MTATYQGKCHCGQIAFEVDGDLTSAMDCNCSICQRKGVLMWFVPRIKLRLLTPASKMATYTFSQRLIQHHFCPSVLSHKQLAFETASSRPWLRSESLR